MELMPLDASLPSLAVREMVEGGDRHLLLNLNYKRWWQRQHPVVVTCGRETALPFESWAFVVQILQAASLESSQRLSI